MLMQSDYRKVDFGVVACANLMNLLMVIIFLSRAGGNPGVEKIAGYFVVALILPLSLATVFNYREKREWWTIYLPALMVLFLLVELFLDYILGLDFRYTVLLWPYLVLYYLSTWGMIGYAFPVNRTLGFLTLVTYFISLGATFYSYSKVGHG